MKKIIFVNRYFYPDHSATSQLLTDLAFDLSTNGHAVVVITSRQLYDRASARLPAVECVNNVRILRAASTGFGRSNLLGRAFDYVSFYWSSLVLLAREIKHGDILVVKTDPPLLSLFASLLGRVKGAKFINWVQDIFPEIAVSLGVKVFPPGINGLVLKWRDRSWRQAWKNVVLGERMKKFLCSHGVDCGRIAIIPNWSDGGLIYPVDRQDNGLASEWDLEGRFVVGYSGNLGRAHDFETLLGAARLLREEKRIAFLFIGAGAQIDRLKHIVVEDNLDNVLFKPYQPREKLAESLSVPDVHIISLLPELEGMIVPSKFYGVAAAGRPSIYIGDEQGEIPLLLEKYACGYAVSPGGSERLSDIISRLSLDAQVCREAGMNARRLFEQYYDKPIALQSWSRLIACATV